MLKEFMMDNLKPLKIGGDLVRLRDISIRLETWRIVIRETTFFQEKDLPSLCQ